MMRKVLLTAALILTTGTMAYALEPLVGDGYTVKPLEAASSWHSYLCAFVGLVAVCVVCFRNPKRTHLD